MKNLLTNWKVLVPGVLVIIIVILIASGALKFNASYTPNNSSPTTNSPTADQKESSTSQDQKKEVVQQSKLTARAVNFSGAKGIATFAIKLPLGWSTSSDSRVDFIAGSMLSETLPNGKSFTANINASGGTHSSKMKSFADYQASWKNETLSQYPSMEFVSDTTKKINGMDTYVLEVKNTRPDGAVIYQTQYVYYVDDKLALVATASVPENSWEKYKEVITLSLESLEKVASESAE